MGIAECWCPRKTGQKQEQEFIMKTIAMAMIGLVLSLGGIASASASTAGNDVLVLFHGQTEVNRETFNFLRRNLSEQGINVNLVASQDPKSIKAGAYRAVVVLSTGLSSGLDPVLKSFVDGYAAKDELFLVSLLKGSSGLTIQKLAVPSQGQEVDAVTAASLWSEGAEKMTYIKLHAEWVKVLAGFLKSR